MNFSTFGIFIGIIGGIISMIGNAIAITLAFGKLSAKIDIWVASFVRFEDGYKEQRMRVDSHIEAIWKKYDILNERLIVLETARRNIGLKKEAL